MSFNLATAGCTAVTWATWTRTVSTSSSAAYKYPREIRFMAEPPKGPSGKILKSVLRDG
jgi:acyl-coenzyme A synthetase/AMP-(fatty) acid ligase